MAAATYELKVRLRRVWPLKVALAVTNAFPIIGHWLVCKTMMIPETQMYQGGKWVTIGRPGDEMICLK